MNMLRFYPEKIRKQYKKNLLSLDIKDPESYHSTLFFLSIILSLLVSSNFFILDVNPLTIFFPSIIFLETFFYFRISLKASAKLKKMEEIFPDVIQLMSSNLRAGMTIDRAFILSARPEFAPMDEEIIKSGKEIATGKDLAASMIDLANRTDSEKIRKTIMLIISGIKSGGDISALLEQTASNMREKEFLEKRAASNVLMYVIFIFFAVGVGAPILFGLSSILVEIIISIVKTLPSVSASSLNMPFTFRDIGLSPNFIKYFALFFIAVTDLISSLVIGLVNTGEEKSGLKYFVPLLMLSLAIFFIIRVTLGKALISTFSSLS
jgi:pilus assembly protein TadC